MASETDIEQPASPDYNSVLAHPASPVDGDGMDMSDCEILSQCIEKYPFFTAAAISLLRHSSANIGETQTRHLKTVIALSASDRRTINAAALGDEWNNFYPQQNSTYSPDTENVIDVFLQTYGGCTPEEERQLERMIFNPTPDYAELLARQEQKELPSEEEDGEPDSQQARINAFIRSQHPAAPHPNEPETPEPTEAEVPIEHPEPTDGSLLSESLARIFIKQGRYERAYEIISGISLKFPKKSAYFADQLRFLQKLIINQRRRQELQADNASEKL